MPEAPEIHALNAEAAEAAAASDYEAASRLLTQVLERQQVALGPDHPDLATTLNNLALMRERAGDIDEARRSYRRAHAIAAAALPPDDPLVRVSDDNLNAFYRAYGRPGDGVSPQGAGAPAPPGLMDFPSGSDETPPPRAPWPPVTETPMTLEKATPEPPLTRGRGSSRDARLSVPPSPPPRPSLAGPQASAGLRPALLAGMGLVLVVVGAAVWLSVSSDGSFGGVPDAESELPLIAPAADSAAPDAAAGPTALRDATPGAPTATDAPSPREAAEPPVPSAKPRSSPPEEPADSDAGAAASVAEADVCVELSRTGGVWRCSPLTGPVGSGSVYYYTRVRTARNLSIRHRWSRNGQTFRESTLRIAANPSAGYRTFTRQSVAGLAAGDWQVSLLTPDGRVLDERRFTVR